MNPTTLKSVAMELYKLSKERLLRGEVPLILGVEGQLALLWDSIRRWNKSKDPNTLADIAAAGLFAFASSVEEHMGAPEEDSPLEEEAAPTPAPRQRKSWEGVVATGPEEIQAQMIDPNALADGEELDTDQFSVGMPHE